MKHWLVFALCWLASGAWGAESKLEKIEVRTDFPILERGLETVMTVCLGCHGLKYIKFRDLAGLGIAKDKVDGWRGANPMGTAIGSQMSADAALQAFGTVPPDLSLMTKAREGGPHYVYAFLAGFYTNDKGKPDNKIFPGTKMPDVMGVAFATGAERTAIENKAKEVASFLEWAGDPKAQERRELGIYVIAYLIVLTILLYLVKCRTWARLKGH